MYLTPQDDYVPPLPSKDCVAIRHPGQVPQSGTRAGIQKEPDYIELYLDSRSRPPSADSSGMTGSANCDVADWWNRPVRPYSTLQILVLRTRFARRK